jgi:adenylate cyclase, class 2
MNEQEIEAKFYVNNLSKIETRLQKLKARLIQARMHEKNLRFDTTDQSLRKAGRVLRLRQDNAARMTYKEPGEKSEGVMSRTEIEFIVEDFGKAKQLLESLGYKPVIFYEKYRTTYELDNTDIMLDELPYGNFIEIEGRDSASIRTIAGKLHIKWEPVATSYHGLFERVCGPRKLDPSQLTFAAFGESKPSPEEMGVFVAD